MFKPIAFASALVIALAASSAKATIIQYTLTGSFEDAGTNNVETLSGGFSWDTYNEVFTSLSITVSGDDYSGTFTNIYQQGPNLLAVLTEAGDEAIVMQFENSLDLGADDPLRPTTTALSGQFDNIIYYSESSDAVAIADTGIPEPGTMALLGVGLAGVWAIRRRRA